MQIQVGINENVIISSVTKNDKGTLVIKLKEGGMINPLEALNASGSTQFKQAEKDMLIYPPNMNNFDGQPDTWENVLKKIAEIKDPLTHILQRYTTNSNIKWDIFAGTGVTQENITTKLTEEDVVQKVYDNIVTQFIKMMTPFAHENGLKSRILLIRQSAAKHYPTFRKKFLETYPFIEPMDIPKEQSKLKFSKFEIEKGFNSGAPMPGVTQSVSSEEKAAVNELFTTN